MLVQAFDHGAFDVEPVESDPADDTPASTILYGEVEPFSAHSTVTTVVTPKTAQEWLGRIPGGYVQSFDVGAFDRSFITSQSRHVTVIPACRRGPSRQRRTVRRSTRTRAPASRRSSDPDLADRARVAGAAR